MISRILYILIPGVLVLGSFLLVAWVTKRHLIDRKPHSGGSQLLAQQNLFDLQTDQGRQALIEQIEMKEQPAADADGEKLDGEEPG